MNIHCYPKGELSPNPPLQKVEGLKPPPPPPPPPPPGPPGSLPLRSYLQITSQIDIGLVLQLVLTMDMTRGMAMFLALAVVKTRKISRTITQLTI